MSHRRPAETDDFPMSREAFAAFGADQLVYIRPVKNADGSPAFAVRAADGNTLGIASSYEQAMAAVVMNDRQAVTLH